MEYPKTATHVVKFDDGKVGWWDTATGYFGGDDDVVASAIMYSVSGWPVRLGAINVGANKTSALGIAGALASYEAGRAFFEVVPDEVNELAFSSDDEELNAQG
ncbi:hypothetical protein ACTXJX_11935 [Glutamicibacter ardleyensis]|uniref:hypothetical protein n=1 Tax=Glutamicibacter ardleyensis TaxID=225894 RepID=UPI003FD21ABD